MSSASAPSAPLSQRTHCPWLFSSIGKKTVVALTGIVLVLFVAGHMLGNLSIFLGPNALNSYAMHLQDLGAFLWIVRIVLIADVVLHIYFTMLLWKENLAARPQKYAVFAPIKTTVAARTMRASGLILLAFIIFHLAHFTLLLVNPGYANLHAEVDHRTVHDVYKMVILGFSNPWVSAFYILAMATLAFHVSHGIASLFQTLGLSTNTMRVRYESAARALAVLFFIGYSAIPFSVLFLGLGQGVLK